MSLVALEDLFDISYGVNLELQNCDEVLADQKGIPFVSRTAANNGVSAYVYEIDDQAKNPANTLSVASGGSVLATFFHPYEYYSGRDIFVLTPKYKMSVQQMLFYCTVIEANQYRYSYGRQANKTLKRIFVPSPESIPPFVSTMSLATLSRAPKTPANISLSTESWRTFALGELFDIHKGKRLTKEDMYEGDLPFIGSTEYKNGVTALVGNDHYVHEGNVLTVAYNGSVAQSFYQAFTFVASDDVNILKPRGFVLNQYLAMFLITLLQNEQYRFSYGRKWSKEKMEVSTIQLPATTDGKPDFDWMSRYIQSLPYSSHL